LEPVRFLSRALTGRILEDDVRDWTDSEWLELVERAIQEGVGPLLYDRLGRLPAQPPEEPRRRLEREYYNTAAGNVLLYQELARILAALEGEEVLVLKGADLAASLYPNIALRPMGDIDLLVHPEALDAALHRLSESGYTSSIPEMAPGFNRLLRHGSLLTSADRRGVGVDLHWSLVYGPIDRRAPDLDWFWSRAETSAFESAAGQIRLPRLSATAHFLYLAAHLVLQHGASRGRLVWYYDLHLLSTLRTLDWTELFRQAESIAWSDALCDAVTRTCELFGTELPEALNQCLRRRERGHDGTERPQVGQRELLPEWKHLPWRGRITLVRGLVLPTVSYVQWRYRPKYAWLWPLCYGKRWLSFARRTLV
jgi:hypothetical protein